MIVGALAIAETDPSYAERIVPAAVKSLPLRAQELRARRRLGRGPGLLELRDALHGLRPDGTGYGVGEHLRPSRNRRPFESRALPDLHRRADGPVPELRGCGRAKRPPADALHVLAGPHVPQSAVRLFGARADCRAIRRVPPIWSGTPRSRRPGRSASSLTTISADRSRS